jgi:hypothetical protein
METILNLAWLGVTLAVLWLWWFRWTVSRENRRHTRRQEAVAVLCFIAFVFPVISLTDDLHPEIVAVDAASGKRNAALHVANSSHARFAASDTRTHLAPGLIPKSQLIVIFTSTETVQPAVDRIPVSIAGNISGRSPPSLL